MNRLKRIGLILLIACSVSFAFSEQDPSVLLEKAIYTEETLGNLADAIGLYQKIVNAAESSREISATALFRLGMCYQKSGRRSDAEAAFNKLIKLYPEQRDLISRIPRASAKEPQSRRVPWLDGEELQFVNDAGRTVAIQRMESVPLNGKAAWKYQAYTIRSGTMAQDAFRTVYMNASNLMPISSSSFSQQSDLSTSSTQTNYTPGVVQVLTGYDPDESQGRRQLWALDREVYDTSQVEMVIRTLPLREGFHTTFPILSAWVGAGKVEKESPLIDEVKISVPVREKITVPAGIFECYKVVRVFSTGATVYWISTDEHAYIVKVDDVSSRALKSIRKLDKNQRISFDDRDLEISISAPSGWYIVRATSFEYTKAQSGRGMVQTELPEIRLQEPFARARGTLTSPSKAETDSNAAKSLEQWVNSEIGSRQYRPDQQYEIRAESRSSATISGLPAIRYIADVKFSGPINPDRVEYAFYFMKSGKGYKLVFQVPSKRFDSMKSSLDSIANSIVVR